MKYVTPVIAVLGNATTVIQSSGKGNNNTDSGISGRTNSPAYDLDD